MAQPIKALLLDHDGTLVNSEPCQFQIWQGILQSYGVDYQFSDFIPRIGIPGEITSAYLVKKYRLPISPAALAKVKEEQTDIFLQTNAFPLMPGIQTIINWAKENKIKLAVVSGAERASVVRSLQHHNLLNQLEVVVAGGDVEVSKPAPDCYLKALSELGINAEQAVAIEDSASGIQSAKAANLKCFAIQHDFTPAEKLSKADKYFSSHHLILDALKQL